MNFNNYTTKAAKAVQGTMQLAGQLSHQAITPLHFLLVLVQQPDGLAPALLRKTAAVSGGRAVIAKQPGGSGNK
jgi:ATP-dependent Clp protease ATP-binding subunit ClpA